MKPSVAALVAALVSGTAMYSVGAWTNDKDVAVTAPAADYAVAPGYTVTPVAADSRTALRPANNVVYHDAAPQPRRVRTVAASSAPQRTTVVTEEATPQRSWKKSALIIGGSAAGGAGLGGVLGGKKGAITGAAIGGGAASIYEAMKRHD